MDVFCRLCMNDCDLIPVLYKNRTNVQYNTDSYEAVVKKIDFCLGLTVSCEDDLTKSICLPCLSSLNTFYEYKKRSISAQEFLKKYRIQDNLQHDFKHEVTSTDPGELSDLQIEIKESKSPVKQGPSIEANSTRTVEPAFVPGLLVEVRNEARFECSTCGEMLKSEHAREEHNNLNHGLIEILRCKICSRVCKTSSGLKTHIRQSHRREKKSNKETEISDHSSNDSSVFRSRFRSRSRTYSTSTERSVSQEDQERNRNIIPQKIRSRRGEGILKVDSLKHISPKKTNEETIQKKSEGGECSTKIQDPYQKFLEKYKDELKDVRVVLKRFDEAAYKKINSVIFGTPEDKNNRDSSGSPPPLIQMNSPVIENSVTDEKESQVDLDQQLNSPPPAKRTRKKAIVFQYDEEDEDFDLDDIDDPSYTPIDQNSKDYMVDVEVVEEMDTDNFDSDSKTVKNTEIENKSSIAENQTNIVPPNKSPTIDTKTVQKDIVKIKPNNVDTNIKKRKANSDDPLSLFTNKLMVFNLRMADHSDLPFRVSLKYSENVALMNKSVTKMVPHEAVIEDTGGADLGKKLTKVLNEDLQVWLSQMYTKFTNEVCPFMIEEDTELEIEEIDNEETMENGDIVENEAVDKTVPTTMNQACDESKILNSENSIGKTDSVNVPFIRVKNPQELGIDFPPSVTINTWQPHYENILHNDHAYAQS